MLSGQKSGTGDAPQVLVKMNVQPSVFPAMDALLKVCNAEIRECWKSAQGIVPETVVVPGLASRELALSLPAAKRRRDSLQSPGTWMCFGCSVRKRDLCTCQPGVSSQMRLIGGVSGFSCCGTIGREGKHLLRVFGLAIEAASVGRRMAQTAEL